MRADILSGQFVVNVQGIQIDLYFDITNKRLQVFADSELISNAYLNDRVVAFYPNNVLELAVYWHSIHIRNSLERERQTLLLDRK